MKRSSVLFTELDRRLSLSNNNQNKRKYKEENKKCRKNRQREKQRDFDKVNNKTQISGYCLPGKGTLEFFFSPLYRANFDDLRPLKAKFDTFEHLWGSKTWFRAPEISWFLPKTSRFLKNLEKKIFFPGKILTPE